MATYRKVTRAAWAPCARCQQTITGDWYWAPSRQAPQRELCATCYGVVDAAKLIALALLCA